jgi:hypothetical protein
MLDLIRKAIAKGVHPGAVGAVLGVSEMTVRRWARK